MPFSLCSSLNYRKIFNFLSPWGIMYFIKKTLKKVKRGSEVGGWTDRMNCFHSWVLFWRVFPHSILLLPLVHIHSLNGHFLLCPPLSAPTNCHFLSRYMHWSRVSGGDRGCWETGYAVTKGVAARRNIRRNLWLAIGRATGFGYCEGF